MQKTVCNTEYAKTVECIERLGEVIGLKLAGSNLEYPDNWYVDVLFSSGKAEGWAEGIEIGKLEMTVRFKEEFGIDEAVKISGFSREEIENFENSNE